MMSHNLVVIFHKIYLQQSGCIVVLFDDQILTQMFKCCNRQKSFKAPIKSITCRILTRSKQVINISRCNFVNIFPALNKQFGVEMEFTASLKLMQGEGPRFTWTLALDVCGLDRIFCWLNGSLMSLTWTS